MNGQLPSHVNVAFHLGFIAAWTAAALVKREAYHTALPIVMLMSFGAYIALLFARL